MTLTTALHRRWVVILVLAAVVGLVAAVVASTESLLTTASEQDCVPGYSDRERCIEEPKRREPNELPRPRNIYRILP